MSRLFGPNWEFLVGDAAAIPYPDRSFDMTLFSPPYENKRLYGDLGFRYRGQDWVDWMVPRVIEACRVTEGPVFVNMWGPVRNHSYQPVVEWLVTDLTRRCGLVCGPRPYCWERNGAPGKNEYHRSCWEPVYSFLFPDRLPIYTNPTAVGHPPKYRPGGGMTARKADGGRQPGRQFKQPDLANPGDIIRTAGGHLGDRIAHECEAPFSEGMAEYLILSYCQPGGKVLDSFSGSGTTVAVAVDNGRHGIGIDARFEMVMLGQMRLLGKSRDDYQKWLVDYKMRLAQE